MGSTQANCTIRAAQSGDLMAVLSVHARRDTGGVFRMTSTEIERQTWKRMMEIPGLGVYVAELGGDVVGTASMMLFPNVTYDCAPTAVIEAVVVVSSYRRQGIATALIQRILKDAKSAGCNKVQLLSHKRHSADGAHRLYSSLGFESEAEGFRLYLGKVPPAVQGDRDK
jgi:GNAT superfamily N-acetyltransferase